MSISPFTLKRLIADSDNIVAFTGAGVSTESGLPDFRGPDGIWTKDPASEKIFDITHFKKSADVRDRYWSSRLGNIKAVPNDGHHALAALYNAGKLSRVVTQNIDGLHQASGIPDIHVSELHGSMSHVDCIKCSARLPLDAFLAECDLVGTSPSLLPCHNCARIFKPGVVMFGEALDKRVWRTAERSVLDADLLLVVGSSLSVYPAAGLVGLAQMNDIPTVIINATPTDYDDDATMVSRGPIGDTLRAAVSM